MKNRLYLGLPLLALLGLAGWTAHTRSHGTSPVRQTWEYQEVQLSSSESATPLLNELGAEGWELVNVAAGCFSDQPCTYWAYMKRAK